MTLVERFDIEPISDFTTKWSNFRGLFLGCTNIDFCNQILIFQHFSRSTRFAILCTAQISKFRLKIVKFFAKLNIEYSIEIAHFQYEKCYFSSKWRWNFVGISGRCSKMSKFVENSRNFAKNFEKSVKIPDLIEKFNRKIRWFNPVLNTGANNLQRVLAVQSMVL